MNINRIEWDVEWMLEHFESASSLKELCTDYNKDHGTDIGYNAIRGFFQRRGMKRCNLTEEQDLFIRENYPRLGVSKLTESFNKYFGTNKTYQQMRALVNNRKLTIADEQVYKECRANKRGCKYEVGEMTQGWQEPYVKVGENRFIHLDRYNFEQKYGKLPKGYKVIHLDGDPHNHKIENLEAISPYCSAIMARNKLFSCHPIVTKGAIMCCELQEKIVSKESGVSHETFRRHNKNQRSRNRTC